MSAAWTISVPGVSNIAYKVDIAQFVQSLRSQWNVVYFSDDCGPGPLLEWEIRINENDVNYLLTGCMWSNQLTVILDSVLPYAARFAVWYRTLVPNDVPLEFHEPEWMLDVEPVNLEPGITHESLLHQVNERLGSNT